MEAAQVEAGSVLRWPHDDRPIRVLVHDGGVVMYDTWWPYLGGWGLADLDAARKGRVNYYATTTSVLMENATLVRSEPLTEAEIALHRPDLPFAVAECQVMSWPSEEPELVEGLESHRPSAGCPGAEALAVPEVYLFPFGPKGGTRAGVRVRADNGISFRWAELVWKACVIQARFVRAGASAQGVGIYRAGLSRGIPAYYLWGAQSRLHGQS